jgi:hypothetical protein
MIAAFRKRSFPRPGKREKTYDPSASPSRKVESMMVKEYVVLPTTKTSTRVQRTS